MTDLCQTDRANALTFLASDTRPLGAASALWHRLLRAVRQVQAPDRSHPTYGHPADRSRLAHHIPPHLRADVLGDHATMHLSNPSRSQQAATGVSPFAFVLTPHGLRHVDGSRL